MKTYTIVTAAMAALIFCGAHAVAVDLAIDPVQSTIQVVPSTFTPAAFPGTATPGGEATTLSGALAVEYSARSFQVLCGSTLVAADEGSFLPGIDGDLTTPAPAAFVTTYASAAVTGADLEAAVRGFSLSVEDLAPRTLNAGTIGNGTTDVAVLSGEAHLNVGNPPITDLTVFNATSVSWGEGTYAVVGEQLTVTLPFDVRVSVNEFLGTNTLYSGQIVAKGVVPEPTSCALALLECTAISVCSRIRR